MTSLINILLIMTHTLPQLPYAEDALAPRMSKETIEYHHGKHQRTYVDNLNKLIAGTPYENMSLEEIIVRADGPIFNNAAQDWNHTFFFFTLSPTPKSMPRRSTEISVLSTLSKSSSRRPPPRCSARAGHGLSKTGTGSCRSGRCPMRAIRCATD